MKSEIQQLESAEQELINTKEEGMGELNEHEIDQQLYEGIQNECHLDNMPAVIQSSFKNSGSFNYQASNQVQLCSEMGSSPIKFMGSTVNEH